MKARSSWTAMLGIEISEPSQCRSSFRKARHFTLTMNDARKDPPQFLGRAFKRS
jgi:hypothetical protein